MASRTDKNTRLLMLYDALLCGRGVDKKSFSLEHGINERSFDRDVEDIRLFLSESYSYQKLHFDRKENTYYLSGNRPKYLDRMQATIISKIILESGLLCKSEMEDLLDAVTSMVAPRDSIIMKEYLIYDIQSYRSNTKTGILKLLEELYIVMNSGHDIRVVIRGVDLQERTEEVSPLEIVCQNKSFYLIAAKSHSLRDVLRINLKEIVKFEVIISFYASGLRVKYRQ